MIEFNVPTKNIFVSEVNPESQTDELSLYSFHAKWNKEVKFLSIFTDINAIELSDDEIETIASDFKCFLQ